MQSSVTIVVTCLFSIALLLAVIAVIAIIKDKPVIPEVCVAGLVVTVGKIVLLVRKQ